MLFTVSVVTAVRAAWLQNQNIGDPKVSAVGRGCGLLISAALASVLGTTEGAAGVHH
jgi:2-hydroxychromene-2-carboxylate isomerase